MVIDGCNTFAYNNTLFTVHFAFNAPHVANCTAFDCLQYCNFRSQIAVL